MLLFIEKNSIKDELAYYQNLFAANALPACDFKYFSNCFAQSIFLNAVQMISSQGLSFRVWIDPPETI
jgi:hypothetical protein